MAASRIRHQAKQGAVGLGAAGLVVAGLTAVWLLLGAGTPTVGALIVAGAKVDAAVADGAWWRLVAAGALHAGPVHLALNAGLLAFAIVAWTRLGRPRDDDGWARAGAAVALAIVASTGGFTASFLVRAGPSVGASAAAYGLLAALVAGVWLGRADLPQALRRIGPAALAVAFVAVLAAASLADGVDHAAHLGGVVIGALAAPLAHRPGRGRRALAVVALALALVGVVGALSAGRSPGT